MLAPNRVKALDRLGAEIGTHVRAVGCIWALGEGSPFLTADGPMVMEANTLGHYTERHGAPAASLLRHELHVILRQAFGAETIATGTQFTGYTGTLPGSRPVSTVARKQQEPHWLAPMGCAQPCGRSRFARPTELHGYHLDARRGSGPRPSLCAHRLHLHRA